MSLIGVSGCSKKETPAAAPAPNTGSYVLDGSAKNCTAKVYMHPGTPSPLGSFDVLELQLITTPAPQAAAETLLFNFVKQTGDPTSSYRLSRIALMNGTYPQSRWYSSNVNCTLNDTASGGFTGTFSALSSAGVPAAGDPSSSITAGIFTNAQP
ncbi:hypothetical protein GCM10028822_28160 [Hymenobacter terrigena]